MGASADDSSASRLGESACYEADKGAVVDVGLVFFVVDGGELACSHAHSMLQPDKPRRYPGGARGAGRGGAGPRPYAAVQSVLRRWPFFANQLRATFPARPHHTRAPHWGGGSGSAARRGCCMCGVAKSCLISCGARTVKSGPCGSRSIEGAPRNKKGQRLTSGLPHSGTTRGLARHLASWETVWPSTRRTTRP